MAKYYPKEQNKKNMQFSQQQIYSVSQDVFQTNNPMPQRKKRKQQIRTLINDLRNLNPRYKWEGLGIGRSFYTATLPIASQILFELSNRSQLSDDNIKEIDSILQKKTDEDALLTFGRSKAFGTKYPNFDSFLKSKKRKKLMKQMYEM